MSADQLTYRSISARICNERLNSDLRADDRELGQRVDAVISDLRARVAALEAKLNTPELHDFSAGVISEAQHQRARWGSDHDAGKEPADWFWLVGYLAGKALASHLAGNLEKALHHTITVASVMANWHAAILGKTNMRPGIVPPAEETSR